MAIVVVNPAGNTPQGLNRQGDFAARNSLQRLGVSALGAYQVLRGTIVTSPEDRAKIADVVAQALDPVASSGRSKPPRITLERRVA
jgi:hypothetical protein